MTCDAECKQKQNILHFLLLKLDSYHDAMQN